eukprot:3162712-Pyramimonas_sp.AAC.1
MLGCSASGPPAKPSTSATMVLHAALYMRRSTGESPGPRVTSVNVLGAERQRCQAFPYITGDKAAFCTKPLSPPPRLVQRRDPRSCDREVGEGHRQW